MRILIINPPHPSIGSRIPDEHLPPLGLLSIGGPLIDAGNTIQLLDAEFGPMAIKEIVKRTLTYAPEAVLLGHSGSTSGHPVILEISRAIRAMLPKVWIIYGGVFPTFHWQDILSKEPQIDILVRGEGEETAVKLMHALETKAELDKVPGIAFRREGVPFASAPAPVIQNLDDYRIGWELIDPKRYSYWGNRRAVVVQFSRGCPHVCNYCGQRGFWKRWRHRDPKKFAREIAWLHRTYGIEVFNFADENPTSSRKAWLEFLEALIAEQVNVTLVGSTRADDIVRDADVLHVYKKAGVARFLLGIENYDEKTLLKIRKGGTPNKDREAIRLLRQHDILSMATYVVGFEEESHGDYWHGLKQLLSYDPDQIQLLYVTPHRWTKFFVESSDRQVIQTDQSKWDYKHQVLATCHMHAWMVLLWVKFIEAVMQLRPRSLKRVLAHPDLPIRAAMNWYYRIGRRVWPYEIRRFFLHDKPRESGKTLAEFWDESRPGEGPKTQFRRRKRIEKSVNPA